MFQLYQSKVRKLGSVKLNIRLLRILAYIIYCVVCLILSLTVVETYLTNKPETIQGSVYKWMIDFDDFNRALIFWNKPWCEIMKNDCKYAEEQYLSFPVDVFRSGISSQTIQPDCKKILFIGDSFTVAPWVADRGGSYASIAAKEISLQSKSCVVVFRHATGGSATSQQFIALKQVIHKIKPNLVVWQFYWNDRRENAQLSILRKKNGVWTATSTLTNMLYISGKVLQTFQFLKNTNIGSYLLYLGESKDPFGWLAFPLSEKGKILAYNSELFTYVFSELNKLSAEDQFDWVTVLAPLECDSIESNTDDCKNMQENNEWLKQQLVQKSPFIDLSFPKEADKGKFVDLYGGNSELFNTTQDKNSRGGRHLGGLGNVVFGQELAKLLLERSMKTNQSK